MSSLPTPTSRPRRHRLAAAVTGLVLALTACGTPAPTTTSTRTDADADVAGEECCAASAGDAVVSGIQTAHNGWDIAFINWLTPHDAVASQMAELAAGKGASQPVKDVAAKIDAAQGPRYVRMSAMAVAWDQPTPSTDPASGVHDHGGGENEAGKVATLVPLSGAAFDRAFLDIMIAHHQATLPVAQATVDNGTNPEDKQLAQEVLALQKAEIGQMQRLRGAP